MEGLEVGVALLELNPISDYSPIVSPVIAGLRGTLCGFDFWWDLPEGAVLFLFYFFNKPLLVFRLSSL